MGLSYSPLTNPYSFQFDPTEISSSEREKSMALISKLDGKPISSGRRVKPTIRSKTEEVLNVRKAVNFASKGGGSAALARSTEKVKFKKSTKSSRKHTMKSRKT